MAEGATHLRALYYSSVKRLCGIDADEVQVLIQEAITLYREGFSMPVPPGENLSPEGKLFKKLCSISDCTDLLMSMNPDYANPKKMPGTCFYDGWVEYVVYEQGGWATEGWHSEEGIGHCPVDCE